MGAHPGLLQILWGLSGEGGGSSSGIWCFWPEQGWEGALGSTMWGAGGHVEHHGFLSSAGICAFPELGNH